MHCISETRLAGEKVLTTDSSKLRSNRQSRGREMVRPEAASVKRLVRDLRCSLRRASRAVATCCAAPPCITTTSPSQSMVTSAVCDMHNCQVLLLLLLPCCSLPLPVFSPLAAISLCLSRQMAVSTLPDLAHPSKLSTLSNVTDGHQVQACD